MQFKRKHAYILLVGIMMFVSGCGDIEKTPKKPTVPNFTNIEDPRIFLSQLQEQGAIPEADVNRDGIVDILDLVIVAKNFGLKVKLPEAEAIIPRLTHVSAGTWWKNWDADVEDDGFEVSIYFEDDKDDLIFFDHKVEMTVEIKLFTVVRIDFKEVKEREVYAGKFNINSQRDKIRVPKEDIRVDKKKDNEFGWMEMTVTTPKQGSFSARDKSVRLWKDGE